MAVLSLEDHCSAAHDSIQRDLYEEAIETCRRILSRHPLHVRAYAILGEASLAMGEHAEAANLFRRVLGADPENAIAYAGLGVIYEERGLLEEATWHMERAFDLTPYNSGVREALSGLYAQLDITPRHRLKLTRAALARSYIRGQLYPKAVGELRKMMRYNSDRLDIHVALAEALWRAAQYEAARAICVGILNLAPNCLKANLIMGEVLLRDENCESQGRVHLERAQRLDPENQVAQQLLGDRSPLPPRIVPLVPSEGLQEDEDLPLLEELAQDEQLMTVEDILRLDEAEALMEPSEAAGVEPPDVSEEAEGLSATVDGAPDAELALLPPDGLVSAEQEIGVLATEKPSILAEDVPAASVVQEVETPGTEPFLLDEGPDRGLLDTASLLAEEFPAEPVLAEIEVLPVEGDILVAPVEAGQPPEAESDESPKLVEEEPLVGLVEPEQPPEEELDESLTLVEEAEPLAGPVEAEGAPEEELDESLTLAEEGELLVGSVEPEQPPEENLAESLTPVDEGEPHVGPVEAEKPPEEELDESPTLVDEGEPLAGRVEPEQSLEEELAEGLMLPDEGELPTEEAPQSVEERAPETDQTRYTSYLVQLEKVPKDYPVRLELARAYVDDDELDHAFAQYSELIQSRSNLLDDVTQDLEALVERSPQHVRARELLGDAYLKADRFTDALESYQSLLGTTEQDTEESSETQTS